MPTLTVGRLGINTDRPQWPLPLMEWYHATGSNDARTIEGVAEQIIRERWEATQSKPALAQMLSELKELLTEDNPESRPSLDAFKLMKRYLNIAGLALQERFPYGYVMDDGAQGCRIEWENRDARAYASLVIHAQPGESDYIYYQASDHKKLSPLSIGALISVLDQLATK
jgi:hypothetical protein